jgi:flavin reductase (DIM6/NTAB) family NADH-FMN oxidoreductase RutF
MSKIVNDDDSKVFVATSVFENTKAGFVITWVSEASLNRKSPKIILIVSKYNETLKVMERNQRLCLNLLSKNQKDEFCVFGLKTSKEVDKFSSFRHKISDHGIELLECSGFVKCRIDDIFETPDRKILYCSIEEEHNHERPPMILSDILREIPLLSKKLLDEKFSKDSLRDESQFSS